jgi:hypothetical protein
VTAAGEAAAEDVKAIIKATATMKAAKTILDARLDQLTTHVASRRIAPKESGVKLLTAVWYMLGYTMETLADAGQPDVTALSWPVARTQLGADFVAKLNAYDPTVPAVSLAYAKSETLKGTLGDVSGSPDLATTASVLPALAAWAKAALDLKDASVAKRKREAEEAEAAAKAKAEAEAAAKAAAEGGGEE